MLENIYCRLVVAGTSYIYIYTYICTHVCFVSVSVKIVSACKYIFQHTLAYAKLSKCGPWCHLFVAGFGALSYILKTCTGAIYVPSWLPWGLQQMPRAHHACAWCICATCLDLLNTHIIYIYIYIYTI